MFRRAFNTLILTLTASFLAFFIQVKAQDISIDWSVVLGGSSSEEALAIEEAADGGYFVAGYTDSSDGDVGLNLGELDIWIVKLNENGSLDWQKVLGGSSEDIGLSIAATPDGGCILTGYSQSDGGEIGANAGGYDVFLIKLNQEGEVGWSRTYGGSQNDRGFAVVRTTDGGYLIAGDTESSDGDVSENQGGRDFWLIKTDETGNISWEITYGGSGNETAQSIAPTNDGGFAVVGYTGSTNGDVTGGNGFFPDFWLIRINAEGNLLWEKTLGGTRIDWGFSVDVTLDNGFIITGQTESNNQDVSANNGLRDYWVVKLNGNGEIQWETNLGSATNDESRAVKALNDGSYIAVGWAGGQSGDVSSFNGFDDFWIAKLGSSGNLVWEKNFGGSNVDRAYAAEFSESGKLLVCGFSRSDDLDVGENKGGNDVWVVQLQGMITNTADVEEASGFTIYPNPASREITVQLNASAHSYELKIFDVTGRLIEGIKAVDVADAQQLTYPVGHLKGGVYFIQLVAGGYLSTEKFVVNE